MGIRLVVATIVAVLAGRRSLPRVPAAEPAFALR
jgi:hypothetical protein